MACTYYQEKQLTLPEIQAKEDFLSIFFKKITRFLMTRNTESSYYTLRFRKVGTVQLRWLTAASWKELANRIEVFFVEGCLALH